LQLFQVEGTRIPSQTGRVNTDKNRQELRQANARPQRLTAFEPSADAEADIAFAAQMDRYHGSDFHWVPGIGFFTWDGRRFHPDSTETVMAAAEWTVFRIKEQSLNEPNKERSEWLSKLATRYSQSRAVRAAMDFWKPRIAVPPDELDRDRYAYNVLNGTIDLRTSNQTGVD
jgi:putative DNA primase/helicase